jgi:hypothetical protein
MDLAPGGLEAITPLFVEFSHQLRYLEALWGARQLWYNMASCMGPSL